MLVAALVVAAVVAAAWLVGGRRERAPFDIDNLEHSLEVTFEAPPRIGETAVLVVSGIGDASATDATRLSILHTAGVGSYRTEHWVIVEDGRARVPLATNTMREGGYHSVIVFTDAQIGQLDTTIEPAASQPGFIPIVGPTRVIADGESPVLVTLNPVDQFGNPIASGSPVTVSVRRPNGDRETYDSTIDDVIAGIPVISTTDVGVSVVVATVDGQPSEPVEFLQVPGPPAQFELAARADSIIADGRSVLVVQAVEVTDAFGNIVSDGSLLTANITSASGTGVVSSITVNGEADLLIRAPTAPGPLTITVERQGAAPRVLTIDAQPAVERFEPVLVEGTNTVEVGPVLGANGGFAADGAEVELLVGGVAVASAQVVDGYATLIVPAGLDLSREGAVRVSILGVVEEVRYER